MTTTIELYDVADLRDIDDDCRECHGEYVSVDGETCPECRGDAQALLLSRLDTLRFLEIRQRVTRLARRMAEVDVEADVLEAHAAAILARAKARRRTYDGMKRWLQLQMEAAGVDRVKDEFVSVYLQNNPAALEITDEQAVPRTFQRATLQLPITMVPTDLTDFITHVDIPKTPIRDHMLETGELVPGCEYREAGFTRHLRVRS